jgi:glyceraldehyde-3-phosphate dehydrogenase (NADP+)
VLTGGKADGPFFEPTVLADVPADSKVCQMEVFAPLVSLWPFADFKEAVAQVNDSSYGLQAGVFTGSLENALYAFDELEVGGVIINDVPTYRTDPMPYGGVKDSGLGREGPRFAIEEMTEPRLMVLNRA